MIRRTRSALGRRTPWRYRIGAVAVALAVASLGMPTAGARTDAAVPSAAPDEPADPFFSYHRPPNHQVVTTDVLVPVRDGSTISCQLSRPGTSPAVPAAGRFPGIVYEYTAYAHNAAVFGNEAGYFVKRGYNALVCQARGSGASPGVLDPFGPQEQRDNYDVIEWLARQEWSTGRIGQMGVSYGGHSSLLVAVNQPPHLKAIIPMNGIHDWYENTIYRGGIYSARIRQWQAQIAPRTLKTYSDNPRYNDFWRDRSVMARWDRLTIPTLEINGWYDRYRDGMVKNFQARPDQVWLVSGPWEHGYPEGQHAGIGKGAYLAWWDHWLQEKPEAPLPQAKVTSYEIPGPGLGTGWHQYDQWPPRGATPLRLALTSRRTLSRASGERATHTFAVNTRPGPGLPQERLVYATAPLRKDLVLAGSGTATIRAAFSAEDGNIAVTVSDVAPDGTATRVTQGWLKASHRRSHEHPSALSPGEPVDIPVHLWPTHYRFGAGHRLMITVSSDDYPEIDSDAPAGEVSVAVGGTGSSVTFTAVESGPIRSAAPPVE